MDAQGLLAEGLAYERGGALPRALERYQAVLRATEAPQLVARALIRIAHTRRTRCEWDEACEAAAQAAEQAALAGLDALHGEAVNAEAAVHHSRGDLPRATELYQRVLTLTQDSRVCAMALQNLGAIAAIVGDLEEAERRFAEATAAFARAGDRAGEAFVLNSYAAVALDREDFELAEERGLRAVEAAIAVGDVNLLAIAQSNYAEALGALGRFADAENQVTAALGQVEVMGNVWARVHCLQKLGELNAKQQKVATARRFYELALLLAEQIGAQAEIGGLRERLSRLPSA